MLVSQTEALFPWIRLHQPGRPSSGCKGSRRLFLAYTNNDEIDHVIHWPCLVLQALYPQLLGNCCTTNGADPRQRTLFLGYRPRKCLHDPEDQALRSPGTSHLQPNAWYLMGSSYRCFSSCHGSRPSTETHFGHRLPPCGVLLT